MPPQPLIEWPDPLFELLGFLAVFLAAGAVGFRLAVLRGPLVPPTGGPAAAASGEARVADRAALRAALFGLLGSAASCGLLANALPGLAGRRHVTVLQLLTGTPQVAAQAGLLLLALVGFALATRRSAFGWALAATGVLVGPIVPAFLGQWTRLVNPLHELAGGLWIGTLFVLVAAGLPAVLAGGLSSERRGALAAAMVHAFSPLALGAASFLALFGVITAWRHLPWLGALWSTPYGWTLLAKLAVVAVVVGLGAFNWRGLRPQLGSEGAALRLRGSARRELLVAGIVLLITSILVSLPSPRLPGQ